MVTPLELLANGFTAVSVVLAARNSVHTWWTGIVGCALFAWLFERNQLYADVVLQAFFIVTSLVGWRAWRAGRSASAGRIRCSGGLRLAGIVGSALAATAIYGALLHHWTDAYAPYADSAVLAFSVAAQLLLMQRRLETWAGWLVVDAIAVPLYASRGLTLTAALYAFYLLNACYGAWHWWHAWRLANATASGAGEVRS